MGSTTIVGFKKNDNAWGDLPVECGAGDGLEIESESLVLDATLADNVGLSGQGTKRPSTLVAKLCAGDIPCPLYYRGPDLMLAMAFGELVTPVQQGSSAAYLHGLRMAASLSGIYGTLASGGANHPHVREFPFVKNNGFTLDSKAKDLAKISFPVIAFDMHLNDEDDDDKIVVSKSISDQSLTVLDNPSSPGHVTVLVTDDDDSITEMVLTIDGTDNLDAPLQEVYTLSVDGKSWEGSEDFKTVTAVTMTALAGAPTSIDTVQVGADSDPDKIVAETEVWPGTLTIAAQPVTPAPVAVTVTDANTSITELLITFLGLDQDGRFATEVYTLSTDGLTWTSDTRWSSIESATMSGHAGASTGDSLKIGVAYVNDTTSYASISYPATADYQLARFADLKVYLTDQAGADFTDSDEIYPESIQIKLDPTLKPDKITTHFGMRVEEPTKDGFSVVTCNISFPQWDAANTAHIRQRMLASRSKILFVFSGPQAASGYPLQYRFFLNNVQFTSGSPNVPGPGQIPLSLDGEAHQASSSPTGLPAWANTQPMSAAVVNLRSSAMWT